MRKIIIVMLLTLTCSISMQAQSNPTYNADFVYDERIHDFGTILEKKGKVSHTFTFTNKSSKPIVITEASAWCGCATADFSRKPVMPGKSTRLTVTYNPYNRPGKFSKEVNIILNGGSSYTRVWVKGIVKGYVHPVTEDYPYAFGEGLYLGYKVLAFPPLNAGASYTFTQRIANNSNTTLHVKFLRQPNNTVLKMPAEITLKPKERTSFKVTYRAPKRYTINRYINVYPLVNGKKLQPIRINFFGFEK